MRALLAACKPREHGLWAWALVPQLAAVALAPGAGSLLGALAVVAGFGASNALGLALRRGESAAWRAVGLAGGLAALLGAAALAVAPAPVVLVGALALAGLGGVGVLLATGGRLPRTRALELPGLAALGALGAAVALAGGAPPGAAGVVFSTLLAWFLLSFWHVDRTLAAVIGSRSRWAGAPWLAGLASAWAVLLGVLLGHPAAPAVLLLYALRVRLHRSPERPKGLKRFGLIELGWSVGAALLAAGLAAA